MIDMKRFNLMNVFLPAIALALPVSAFDSAQAAGPGSHEGGTTITREVADHWAGIVRDFSNLTDFSSQTLSPIMEIIPEMAQLNMDDPGVRETMKPVIDESWTGMSTLMRQYHEIEGRYNDAGKSSIPYQEYQSQLLALRGQWIILAGLKRLQPQSNILRFETALMDYRHELAKPARDRIDAEIHAAEAAWHAKLLEGSSTGTTPVIMDKEGPRKGLPLARATSHHSEGGSTPEQWLYLFADTEQELFEHANRADLLAITDLKIEDLKNKDAEQIKEAFEKAVQAAAPRVLMEGLQAALTNPTSREVSHFVRLLRTASEFRAAPKWIYLYWASVAAIELDLLRYQDSPEHLSAEVQRLRVKYFEERTEDWNHGMESIGEAPPAMKRALRIPASLRPYAKSGFKAAIMHIPPHTEGELGSDSSGGRRAVLETRELAQDGSSSITIIQEDVVASGQRRRPTVISNDLGRSWRTKDGNMPAEPLVTIDLAPEVPTFRRR